MISTNNTPYSLRVAFLDNGIKRVKYCDDSKYWSEMVARHGHLSNLSVEPLVLSTEQQQRLDNLPPSLVNPSLYVEYGTDEPDTSFYNPELYKKYQIAQTRPFVELQRKRKEDEGVVYNNIRYSGSQSNRQALSEALVAAEDDGSAMFDVWLDSDGNVHYNVPVEDVRNALRAVGGNRKALISLEAQLVEAVVDGDADLYSLDWSTPES